MNGISPIDHVTRSAGIALSELKQKPEASPEAPGFSQMFHAIAGQAAATDNEAARAVSGLLRGDGTDVHQAMIATQKADIVFEMALQVRNRAVSAYQQMTQMQF